MNIISMSATCGTVRKAYRRIRGDMIAIYKLLHRKCDSNTSNIIIELAMWLSVCVWTSAPRMAYVTVTKIAGYVRVRILMNR